MEKRKKVGTGNPDKPHVTRKAFLFTALSLLAGACTPESLKKTATTLPTVTIPDTSKPRVTNTLQPILTHTPVPSSTNVPTNLPIRPLTDTPLPPTPTAITGQEKAEDVWITEVDPLDMSTWTKEMKQYWTDVSIRPNDPEATEAVQKGYEVLDDEFVNKYWLKATEAFLTKAGIDVTKFNFGRVLDRPTMLTWGLIKWQQDHLQDYRDGKITLENWLLKIPPSVIRHLVQDQYNYTVSYQEKIEGTNQPKTHDGIYVKFNNSFNEAKSFIEQNNPGQEMKFPILGLDLKGEGWPRHIPRQSIGDLSGLFLLPGKELTDQIGILSGNEGQPNQGMGLFPFTISFKDRSESYRFWFSSGFKWEKLPSPITAKASHVYNNMDPLKIEEITAALGGKIRIDSIETMGGVVNGYIINTQYGLTNADQFDIIIPDLEHPEVTEVKKKGYSPVNQPWQTVPAPTPTP